MQRIRFHDNRPDLIRRRLAEIAAEERFRSSVYWRSIGLILLFTGAGLALMAGGLTSSSATLGPLLFWAGVLGADIGIATTLGWAYLRLEG